MQSPVNRRVVRALAAELGYENVGRSQDQDNFRLPGKKLHSLVVQYVNGEVAKPVFVGELQKRGFTDAEVLDPLGQLMAEEQSLNVSD